MSDLVDFYCDQFSVQSHYHLSSLQVVDKISFYLTKTTVTLCTSANGVIANLLKVLRSA